MSGIIFPQIILNSFFRVIPTRPESSSVPPGSPSAVIPHSRPRPAHLLGFPGWEITLPTHTAAGFLCPARNCCPFLDKGQ